MSLRAGAALVLCLAAALANSATLGEDAVFGPGRARGAFLLRSVGARAAGMGEAFTAVADDASAVLLNPGGLGQIASVSALGMYEVLGDGMGVSHGAAAIPLGSGAVGFGITAVSYGSYEMLSDEGVDLGRESLMDLSVAGSVSFENPQLLGGIGWSGLSLEYVKDALGGSHLGASAGGVWPISRATRLGFALLHAGQAAGGYRLPAVAKAGAAYALAKTFRLAADLGHGLVDGRTFVSVGVEMTSSPPLMALRAGYKWSGDRGPGGLTGLTAGLGVRVGDCGLDYAYQPFGDLSGSHRVSLVYGKGTEEAPGP